MTFGVGYLTGWERRIWDLRWRRLNKSKIVRRLSISRQAVHSALSVIDSKVERGLTRAYRWLISGVSASVIIGMIAMLLIMQL